MEWTCPQKSKSFVLLRHILADILHRWRKQSLKTATEVPPETCSCRFQPYITLKLFRKSARSCIVLTLYKTATVWSGLHQQTFDQQKWLYCWCQFLSYCLLIVFNKGSIGTNYMGLRLGIDNVLCLMMCKKLWLCVCMCVCVFER